MPVKGTVSPRKRFVTLMVQQRKEGRYRRAGVRAVRARRGRFSSSFTPAVAATYAREAAIFRAMIPDFPTPETITRPREWRIVSTAFTPVPASIVTIHG